MFYDSEEEESALPAALCFHFTPEGRRSFLKAQANLSSLESFWTRFLQRGSLVLPPATSSLERLGPQATSESLTPLAKTLSPSDFGNLVYVCGSL